jgi:hypothetical protein
MKSNNKGGKRKGAGRKPKYNEATTTVAFRVPVSKVNDVKAAVKAAVNTPSIPEQPPMIA